MCALPMPNFYRGIPSATIWNIVWSGRWNTEAHYHRLYTCFMIWALTSCKNKNSKINFFLFLKLTASNLIILISFRIPACLPVDKINLLSFLRIQPAYKCFTCGFSSISSFWWFVFFLVQFCCRYSGHMMKYFCLVFLSPWSGRVF